MRRLSSAAGLLALVVLASCGRSTPSTSPAHSGPGTTGSARSGQTTTSAPAPSTLPGPAPLESIDAISGGTAWAVGPGTILRTTDGGAQWVQRRWRLWVTVLVWLIMNVWLTVGGVLAINRGSIKKSNKPGTGSPSSIRTPPLLAGH